MKKDIFKRIADAKKEKENKIKSFREQLKQAEATKAEADEDAKAALTSADADAYAAAKSEGRTAADKIEFYKLQLEDLNKSSLFGKDSAEVIKEIETSRQAIIAEASERAVKAMHDVAILLDAYFEDLEEMNKALEIVCENTNRKYSAEIALPMRALYRSADSARTNPELSKYW